MGRELGPLRNPGYAIGFLMFFVLISRIAPFYVTVYQVLVLILITEAVDLYCITDASIVLFCVVTLIYLNLTELMYVMNIILLAINLSIVFKEMLQNNMSLTVVDRTFS